MWGWKALLPVTRSLVTGGRAAGGWGREGGAEAGSAGLSSAALEPAQGCTLQWHASSGRALGCSTLAHPPYIMSWLSWNRTYLRDMSSRSGGC